MASLTNEGRDMSVRLK